MQPLLQWKAINITHSKGVFLALGIQQAVRMRHIVICGLSGSQHLSTFSHKRHDFRKVIEYKIFVLIFSTTLD